jgi:hypothetical protein
MTLAPLTLLVLEWARARRTAADGAGATGPGLERLTADLRRLDAEHRRVALSDLPGQGARLRALSLAYDDTLRDCCRALGLEEPSTPLSALDRLQTEAALAQHGVQW